jgi:hypothetical protein
MTLTPWILAAALSAPGAPSTPTSEPSDDTGYTYAPTRDVVPVLEDHEHEDREGTTFALRAGTASATGRVDLRCSGPGCSGESFGYAQEPSLFFSVDLLWGIGKSFRLGVSSGVMPSTALHGETGGDDIDTGALLSAGLPAEVVLDLSASTSLTFRAQADLLILSGGDYADMANQLGQACEQSDSTCHVNAAPFFGWAAGGGAGFRWSMNRVALRADVMLQAYRVDLVEFSFDDLSGQLDLSGTRGTFLLGVEL